MTLAAVVPAVPRVIGYGPAHLVMAGHRAGHPHRHASAL